MGVVVPFSIERHEFCHVVADPGLQNRAVLIRLSGNQQNLGQPGAQHNNTTLRGDS